MIHLKSDCSLPETSSLWKKHHLESAVNWGTGYGHWMTNYNSLKRVHSGIVVGDSVTPHTDKNVMDLEANNHSSKVIEDDSFGEETVDLGTRLD
ncbi:otubain [Trifolium pratense]|uniref:Otubain n=1 Tax=Trifolium pratense TaxID=57577 RepID=A0A2K3MHK7_TRIPR|nr:hypothetical protein L195_g049977 [Trifolium pratense]PNX90272.1 hypothetical protein L195_g046395 [Trifolium pratense]PNX95856.1 otubain [Trifolium pratense]